MTKPLMKYQKVLNKAFSLFNNGQCWIKNHYRKQNKTTKQMQYCAVGAIDEAAKRLGCDPKTAIKKLSLAINSKPNLFWAHSSVVTNYNDTKATFDMIKDVFKKAARS